MYPSSSSSSSSNDDSDRELEAIASATAAVVMYYNANPPNPPKPIRTRTQVFRDRAAANKLLMEDYFDEGCTYGDEKFRTRYRMSKRLFLRIVNDLEARFPYFRQRNDTVGRPGLTPIQKCSAAMRVIGYGVSTDATDEYLKLGEKTCRDTLEAFTLGVKALYEKRYLRKPTKRDLERLYDVHQEAHGLPGMMGSIDCMQWEWANCPTAWRGQYTSGQHSVPSVALQAVCSYDTWVWSAYFGPPGSLNDINILEQSPVIEDMVQGNSASLGFYANDNYYPHGYLLADGIYPEYAFLQKTIRGAIGPKRTNWRRVQESSRKDVERLFGILKKRFAFVQNPCRLWTLDKMKNVMRCCLILHNMILEDDGNAYCQDYQPGDEDIPLPEKTQEEIAETQDYLRSKYHHLELLEDLIEEAYRNKRLPSTPPPLSPSSSSASSGDEEQTASNDEDDYDDVNDTE